MVHVDEEANYGNPLLVLQIELAQKEASKPDHEQEVENWACEELDSLKTITHALVTIVSSVRLPMLGCTG